MKNQSSLIDGGTPEFAERCGLGDRYRYWLGTSGRRHLFTAVDASALPDFNQAVIVLARRDGNGGYRGVDVGCPGDAGEETAAQILRRLAGDRELAIFVHLLAGNAAARRRLVRDLVGSRQQLAA